MGISLFSIGNALSEGPFSILMFTKVYLDLDDAYGKRIAVGKLTVYIDIDPMGHAKLDYDLGQCFGQFFAESHQKTLKTVENKNIMPCNDLFWG